jgi:hypothetical protein
MNCTLGTSLDLVYSRTHVFKNSKTVTHVIFELFEYTRTWGHARVATIYTSGAQVVVADAMFQDADERADAIEMCVTCESHLLNLVEGTDPTTDTDGGLNGSLGGGI